MQSCRDFKPRAAGAAFVLAGAALCLAAAPAGAESPSSPATAAAWMQKAHDGRAVWDDFPGFEAQMRCRVDGETFECRIQVDRNGEMQLSMPLPERFAWVRRTLDSVIGHRLSSGAAATNVEFADDQADHPHGRLLRSLDPENKSLWRAQGDVLTEVHRFGKESRFVISVTDVWRTPEGKHLPKSYDVVTWSVPSGQIQSVRQVHQEWRRVGKIDLPTRYLAITNGSDGSRVAHQIEWSEHILPSS